MTGIIMPMDDYSDDEQLDDVPVATPVAVPVKKRKAKKGAAPKKTPKQKGSSTKKRETVADKAGLNLSVARTRTNMKRTAGRMSADAAVYMTAFSEELMIKLLVETSEHLRNSKRPKIKITDIHEVCKQPKYHCFFKNAEPVSAVVALESM